MAAISDNSFDRLGIMLFVAVALHAIIILGITFDFTDRAKQPPAERTLDIIVVHQPKTTDKVEDARFFAQANQQGGGETDTKKRPSAMPSQPQPPLPPVPEPHEEIPPTPATTPVVEQQRVLTSARAPRKIRHETRKKPIDNKELPPSIEQLLASTDQEISRLTAEIERNNQAFSQKSRRKHISAATKEYIYANYLDAWRRKVERIGNLNYPEEAKRKNLSGSLVLHVAVRADGSLERVRVLRSSGKKVLDDAAIRIVKLAAPFSPFPEEIRKNVDVLDITRTWQFGNDDRLSTSRN